MRISRYGLLSLTATATSLASCGGSPAPAPIIAKQVVPIAPTSTASVQPPPPPLPPAAPESSFHIAIEGGDLVVSALAGRTFVHSETMSAGSFIGEVVDGNLVYDPAHSAGLDQRSGNFMLGTRIAGSWPDQAFLIGASPYSRSGVISIANRWQENRWKQIGTFDGERVSIAHWSNGRLLAMMDETRIFAMGMKFEQLAGPGRGVLPIPRKGKGQQCRTETHAHEFTALPSGHVFVVGDLCTVDSEPTWSARVERWAPNEAKSTVDLLPQPAEDAGEVQMNAIWARSPTDVTVVGSLREGKPYLAKFDGTAWKLLDAPASDLRYVRRFAGDEDGTLWLVLSESPYEENAKGELWRRIPDGAWSKMEMPPAPAPKTPGAAAGPLQPQGVWVAGPGDVWVGTNLALLHNKPVAKVFARPGEEEINKAAKKYRLATPYEANCETPFVLLFPVSKSAPANFDFPAVRQALVGHPEFKLAQFLDFESAGKRYLGAHVPDEATGRKLVTLAKAKVPGSTAQLVCHDPEPTRILSIDTASVDRK